MTAEDYIRQVNFWLTDLPWGTKKALLSELRGHLAELPADTDLDTLGTPEQYAKDLRAAAGLERRRGPIAFLRARRPRNLILVALTLTVIGLALGAVAWIDSYQPLAFGNGWEFPADANTCPGSAVSRSSSRGGSRSRSASKSATPAGTQCGCSAYRAMRRIRGRLAW